MWVETMRTFTYRGLSAVNDLEVGGGGRGTVHALTAASVMYASETMARVLSDAVQIHGGSGGSLGVRGQPAVSFEQAAGNRCRSGPEIRKIIIAGELLK